MLVSAAAIACGEEREGLMADQMRHGLPQCVRGLLEQERWIGTGFYAHVRVTRVNDGTVLLRVRPHAQPGRFFTVWIVVLLAWGGSRLRVIPLNWQAIAGARSELARPRGQLAHRAACRGIRSPRYMLLASSGPSPAGWGLMGRLLH